MKIEISVILAGPQDATTLAGIARDTFYETWRPVNTEEDMQAYIADAFSLKRLEDDLASDSTTFLLASIAGEIVGYAKLRRDRSPDEFRDTKALEIERMYVRSTSQRLHVGSALMNRCLEIAGKEGMQWMWLGVNIDNHKAIAFYQQYGFEIFGRKQFQLGNAVDDDYLMKRRMPAKFERLSL